MKIRFGIDLYGRIWQPDGSLVATRFFHILYLPLIPLGSYRVHRETNDGFTGQRVGLRLGSVLSGYFKVWGFLAALGLLFWGFTMVDRHSVPWSEFLAVPLCGTALLAVVIGSWFWLGTARGQAGRLKRASLSVGIPTLICLLFFGYWWWDRYDFKRDAGVRETADSVLLPSRESAAERKRHGAYLVRSDNKVQKLYPLVLAAYDKHDKKNWKGQVCDDRRIEAAITDERGKHLAVAEYAYLAYLARPGDKRDEYREKRSWLVSDSVKDFPYKGPVKGDPQLDELDKHPFFGVVLIADAPSRAGKRRKKNRSSSAERRTLKGWLAVFDVSTGEFLCDARFEVDSTAGRGEEPPPEDIQAAFKAAARAALRDKSKLLRVFEDR